MYRNPLHHSRDYGYQCGLGHIGEDGMITEVTFLAFFFGFLVGVIFSLFIVLMVVMKDVRELKGLER